MMRTASLIVLFCRELNQAVMAQTLSSVMELSPSRPRTHRAADDFWRSGTRAMVLTGQELCSHCVEKLRLPCSPAVRLAPPRGGGTKWAAPSSELPHEFLLLQEPSDDLHESEYGPLHKVELQSWSPDMLSTGAGMLLLSRWRADEKLNWSLSAPLSPLNYSTADGAPETTALEGSQRCAGGILWRCTQFPGKEVNFSSKKIISQRFSAVRFETKNLRGEECSCDTRLDTSQTSDSVILSGPGRTLRFNLFFFLSQFWSNQSEKTQACFLKIASITEHRVS